MNDLNSDSAPLIALFQIEIEKVINAFHDQGLTVGEAIGVLELCKLDLWQEQQRPNDDP